MKEFGILTDYDCIVLKQVLGTLIDSARSSNRTVLKICEIGVCHGDTARGIKNVISSEGLNIEYWGVDSQKDTVIALPFPEANIVIGESTEVYDKIPDGLDLLIIDGCHCVNHVMLDFLNYAPHMRKDGFVLFHDVAPRAQGKFDYQGHGPKDNPDFGTATQAALLRLGLWDNKRTDYILWNVSYDASLDWGGFAIYQKVE